MAEEAKDEVPPAKKPSKLKLVLFIVLGTAVVSGATLGALFFAGMLNPQSEVVAADAVEEEAVPKEAHYISLEPAFTVNFQDTEGARFLKLTMEAMSRDPDIETLIARHMPVIRNDLTLLLSSKSSAELRTREGKEALQKETLASIQKVLEREAGTQGVEAVYFTSFVMQ